MEDARIQRFLDVFASMGEIYQTHDSDPTWDKYPQALCDRVQSLAVFLDGYAFERAGRAPRYSTTAVKVIKPKRPEELDAPSIWRVFRQELAGEKVNAKVNPLAPKGTEFRHKGTAHHTVKISVIELEGELKIPLVKWVVDNLPNAPRIVYDRLQEISGIGAKIASYFMRDVACRFNVFPVRAEDRPLLQPVDVWVERAAKYLGAQPGAAADFLVRCSGTDRNRPERVNQGIWLFSAEVVGSQEMLETFLCKTSGKDQVMRVLRQKIAHLQEVLNLLESAPGTE